MNGKENKLRIRDIAHLWGDKRVLSFLRKRFERVDYKPLRNVYLALCEIDSDFVEERNSKETHLHALTKTCATYAGMDQNYVTEALQFLRFIKLIDYGRKYGDDGRTVGSFLTMYKWEGFDFHSKEIKDYKTLIREIPDKVITGCYKNIINNRFFKNIIYNINNRFFKLFSKENKDCKSNPTDSLSNSDFSKESLTRKIRQKSFTKLEDCPEDVQSLFEFWQGLKIVVHRESKARNEALQKLNTKTQHYPMQEIKKSMQAYKDLLEASHNTIKNKSPYKVGLNEFFGFSKDTKERIQKSFVKLQGIKSWFEVCLQDESDYKEKFNGQVKDEYPKLTENIINTIEGLSGRRKLDFDQRNLCGKVSNEIYTLWRKEYKNRDRFNIYAKKHVLPFFLKYILPWIERKANENSNFDIPWMLTPYFIDDINKICQEEINEGKDDIFRDRSYDSL